jgi:hypothetical protein
LHAISSLDRAYFTLLVSELVYKLSFLESDVCARVNWHTMSTIHSLAFLSDLRPAVDALSTISVSNASFEVLELVSVFRLDSYPG